MKKHAIFLIFLILAFSNLYCQEKDVNVDALVKTKNIIKSLLLQDEEAMLQHELSEHAFWYHLGRIQGYKESITIIDDYIEFYQTGEIQKKYND